MNPRAYAAVDLGATSGRVILGTIEDGRLRWQQVSRFPNEPVRIADGLHWDLLGLYRDVLEGLRLLRRETAGRPTSVGIDSWAVDYGLMRGGRLLGLPYHYRDDRVQAGVDRVHGSISPEQLFARNGLQHLPFNTLFQLAAEGTMLDCAERMLLVPDLMTFWLTGVMSTERTNASTTGLLDPRTGEWDLTLAERVGIPPALLAPLVDPGTRVASLKGEVAAAVGGDFDVIAVASHDTASAVAAVPATGSDFAYVSCGTWGLVGVETDGPVLSGAARAANFTNEGGIDGTTRLLRNVMGLWLLSEALRSWMPSASVSERTASLKRLLDEAAKLSFDLEVFDVNDPVFFAPGDMPSRIDEWYRSRSERRPRGRAEIVRCIVESLAQAFSDTAAVAARLADREVNVIHVVGGGSQNALLCQAIADRSGLSVLAGPTEATAIGNLLTQARALGEIPDDAGSIRRLVSASSRPVRYDPR